MTDLTITKIISWLEDPPFPFTHGQGKWDLDNNKPACGCALVVIAYNLGGGIAYHEQGDDATCLDYNQLARHLNPLGLTCAKIWHLNDYSESHQPVINMLRRRL